MYACERDLLEFSAYPDATGDLPVPRALSERYSEIRTAANTRSDVLASQVRSVGSGPQPMAKDVSHEVVDASDTGADHCGGVALANGAHGDIALAFVSLAE